MGFIRISWNEPTRFVTGIAALPLFLAGGRGRKRRIDHRDEDAVRISPAETRTSRRGFVFPAQLDERLNGDRLALFGHLPAWELARMPLDCLERVRAVVASERRARDVEDRTLLCERDVAITGARNDGDGGAGRRARARLAF